MITYEQFHEFMAHVKEHAKFFNKVEQLFDCNIDSGPWADAFNYYSSIAEMLLQPNYKSIKVPEHYFGDAEDWFFEVFWAIVYDDDCWENVEDDKAFYEVFCGSPRYEA